jgi:Rrf2 family iron-sulfur cluster assembly transcriptional regulator
MEGEKCLTHELWKDLSDRLYDFLDGITLSDFVERPEVQEVARRQSRESLRHHLLFGRFAA